ncbi:MAG: methylmalonyl Co-A mutase-associated GTPase MeaB [Nitrospira sp.]
MTDDAKYLVEQVRADTEHRVRAAAQLMSLVENAPERMPQLLVGLDDWPAARMVIGVTGPPGCGKSVLMDRLITALRTRDPARRVGVIAVDPSSPITGGAFLGDRVRMMRHATDPNVFIRSAASRGHVGGLMLGVKGFIRVLGLAGCEFILVETVGVGQNETEIADIADLVVVAIAPGNGDAIQLLKCGLMEIGDIFVINKADCEGAGELHAQLLAVLRLNARGHNGRMPEACLVSALHHRGVDELIDLIEQHAAECEGQWQARRQHMIFGEIKEAVLEESRRRILQALGPEQMATEDLHRILRGEVTVAGFVDEILQRVIGTPVEKGEHRG